MIFPALVAWLAFGTAVPAPPAACPAENSVGRCVIFTIVREGVPVPKYSIVVREDRKAIYWKGDREEDALPVLNLSVSEATKAAVFKAVPVVGSGKCETHTKGIAQTGRKTLQSFEGDEVRSCVFNYSDSDAINAATSVFQSMASTMEYGEQLAAKHRFDRLALDALMDSLVNEVKEGRAIEVQNIAPVLRSLAEDDRVIDRVRRKAARLLQDAGVDAPALPDKAR